MNDYYEEPIALVEHDGFWEGGQLLIGDEVDVKKLKTMGSLYSSEISSVFSMQFLWLCC